MPVQLTWKSDWVLGAIHLAHCASQYAAECTIRNPDSRELALRLGGLASSLDITQERIWNFLFQLAPDSSGSRDLAERICIRCLRPDERSERLVSQLSAAIQDAQQAFTEEFSEVDKQLQLRQRPLREQWEAYGPGLLHQMAHQLDPTLFVERAEVYLVPPVLGGLGWAHLHTNRCHIEAVLTNADPQLTETVRLAWLVSQLDFERPQYSDLINAHRLRAVAGLAMLPPTLMAAQELGLAPLNVPALQRAIELWRLQPPGNQSAAMAEVLTVWWETVRSGKTRWSVALTGLDRMLCT